MAFKVLGVTSGGSRAPRASAQRRRAVAARGQGAASPACCCGTRPCRERRFRGGAWRYMARQSRRTIDLVRDAAGVLREKEAGVMAGGWHIKATVTTCRHASVLVTTRTDAVTRRSLGVPGLSTRPKARRWQGSYQHNEMAAGPPSISFGIATHKMVAPDERCRGERSQDGRRMGG